VDDIGTIIIVVFFILIGVLERVLKGAQKGKAPPGAAEPEPEDVDALEGMPANLQELIAEELGINLERRPKVRQLPEPAPPSTARVERGHPASRQAPRPAVPGPVPRVSYPKHQEDLPDSDRESAGDRALAAVQQRRERLPRRRRPELTRRREDFSRRPLREPDEEAVSLERPRRPEDHERFHGRYGVPKPVESHSDFHRRYVEEQPGRPTRRPRTLLPERADWSAAQKAIIWAEILGPPKGLDE